MLTFAGEPLLFPGPLGPEPKARELPFAVWETLDKWLAYHLDLGDLNLFGETDSRLVSARQACRSRFEINKGLGLPIVNWPSRPKPRINTLYWPTGATRWAHGLFLATRATVARILEIVHPAGSNTVGTLLFGDENGTVIETDMYMLAPRPVSGVGEADDLFLIPLVDQRYFWQYTSFGSNTVTTSTTWASLFSTFGATLVDAISGNYLKPDPTDFTRPYDNAALLLDAAAWSVGRRIVRLLDGTLYCQSKESALLQWAINDLLVPRLLGGGDFSTPRGDIPGSIEVTFRKIKQYLLRANGALYTVQLDKVADDQIAVSGRTFTIHCSAYADYNTSDVLQNGSTLATLAAQIRDDYYGWFYKAYDAMLPGIVGLQPTGYDDAILWRFGSLCDGRHQAQTRAWTLPANVWPEINLCSDSTKEVVEPRMLSIAEEDIAAGAEGTVSLYSGWSTDTGKDVECRNASGTQWSNGNTGSAEGIGDAEWVGSPTECP